jgi:hypothetical protein
MASNQPPHAPQFNTGKIWYLLRDQLLLLQRLAT